MPYNLVMTSAYAVRTDFGSRGKKLCRVVKGVSDITLLLYILRSKAKQIFSQQHKNTNKRHPSKN